MVLTLLVLAVNAAVSNRSEGPAQRIERLAYLDEVRPHVQRSNDQGTELAGLRDGAAELGRAGITRRLDRLARDTTSTLAGVRAVEPPPSLATSHSLLISTMFARSRAIAAIQSSMVRALGTDSPDEAVKALVEAGADLVTADRTYALFSRSLPKGEGIDQAALPESAWVQDPSLWEAPEMAAFVATLRSTETLAPVHDVSVVLMSTDPPPLAREGDADVLPVVKTMKVQIVVANVGNEAEKKVPVVATVTGSSGAADSAREFVDLAPGQRRTLTLGGLRPPTGEPVVLSVSIGPVEGDASPAGNELRRNLLFR